MLKLELIIVQEKINGQKSKFEITLREEILAGRKFGEFGEFSKKSPN